MLKYLLALIYFTSMAIGASSTLWATELVFWHSFSPPLSTHLAEALHTFEAKNPSISIRLVYRGNYSQLPETLAQTPDEDKPDIVQLAEYHFHTFKQKRDLYIPLEQLVDKRLLNFPPYIQGFYQQDESTCMALPFNISAGVMYINLKNWQLAGLTEADIPHTWQDLLKRLAHLKTKGFGGLSTAWPAAYIFEHYAAQAGIPLTQFGQLNLLHPAFLKRFDEFLRMSKESLYVYGGQFSDAENLFTNGTVTVFFQGACRHERIAQASAFPVDVYPLPLSDLKEPHALNIGGASLWALSTHNAEKTKAVSLLFNELLKPEVQYDWFQRTHYLPITQEGLELTLHKKSNKTPGYVALEQVLKDRSISSDGVCLAGYATLRSQLMTAIETAMIRGNMTAREALEQKR